MIKEAENQKLTDAMWLMRSNIQEPLSANEIARLLGLNTRRLQRLFIQRFGTQLGKKYIELRVQKAAELLVNTSDTVETIADKTGYYSPSGMWKHFKEHYGVTPSRYRELNGECFT